MPSRATKSGALATWPFFHFAAGVLGELVGVLVLVRRDLQHQALVDGVVGHPVQLGLAGFQQRDAALGGNLQGFLDAVIHFDADGNVQCLGGDAGAERFDHGVAAGDNFFGGTSLGAGLGRTGAACTRVALGCGPLGELLGLVRLVVRAVLRLGRGALAFEGLAAMATGSDGWALLRFNRSATIVGHCVPPLIVLTESAYQSTDRRKIERSVVWACRRGSGSQSRFRLQVAPSSPSSTTTPAG